MIRCHTTARRCALIPLISSAAALAIACAEQAQEPAPEAEPVDCDATPATDPAFPPALAAALDQALAESLGEANAPGVAALVDRPGWGAWYGATGRADARRDDPLDPGARFRVGSVTKTLTAALVMQRAEEGAWSLDDPLDAWVDGFDLGDEVTLRRLLNHTAGVYNYTDDGAFLGRVKTPTPPGEIVAWALTHEGAPAPGQGYLYSNTGYLLLGLAIEAGEGRPYHEAVRSRLLDPLGLRVSFFEQYEEGICSVVQGHVLDAAEPTEGFSMSWAWAAGGLVAPTADLCRWARALWGGQVVTDDTLAAMTEPTALSVDAGEPYGLGVATTTRAGLPLLGHTGSIMGFNGELLYHPPSGTCVVVQTNDFFGVHEAPSERLWAAIATEL